MKLHRLLAMLLWPAWVCEGEDEDDFHQFHPEFVKKAQLQGIALRLRHPRTQAPSQDEGRAMHEAHQAWKAAHGGRDLTETRYMIPVYMTVLQGSLTVGALSPADRYRFVETLNLRFASTPFSFELRGYQVKVNPTWHECKEEDVFKPATRTAGSDVLNVWVCNTHALKAGLAGASNYPPLVRSNLQELDGVVIMNPGLQIFDEDFVFNGLAHEAGHWLGLLHTYEGGCTEPLTYQFASLDSWRLAGDGVEDTPAHDGPSLYKTLDRDNCWQTRSPPLNTCNSSGDDPVLNMMNTIPGYCFQKAGFSSGQTERMTAEYETFRYRNIDYAAVRTQSATTCRTRTLRCVHAGNCCGPLRCVKTRRGHRCLGCRAENRRCSDSSECCAGLACRGGSCM